MYGFYHWVHPTFAKIPGDWKDAVGQLTMGQTLQPQIWWVGAKHLLDGVGLWLQRVNANASPCW
jgi:hypothetical protein